MQQPPIVPVAPAPAPKPKRKNVLAIVLVSLAVAAVLGGLWYLQEKRQDAKDLAEIQASWDAYNASTAWTMYTPSEGGFSILFPGTPNHETNDSTTDDSGLTFDYDAYVAKDQQGIEYWAHVTAIKGEGARPTGKQDLENALGGMMENLDGAELVSSEETTFAGHPALDVVIDAEGFRLRSRLIANGASMIQVMAVAGSGEDAEESYAKFRDSLTLP